MEIVAVIILAILIVLAGGVVGQWLVEQLMIKKEDQEKIHIGNRTLKERISLPAVSNLESMLITVKAMDESLDLLAKKEQLIAREK